MYLFQVQGFCGFMLKSTREFKRAQGSLKERIKESWIESWKLKRPKKGILRFLFLYFLWARPQSHSQRFGHWPRINLSFFQENAKNITEQHNIWAGLGIKSWRRPNNYFNFDKYIHTCAHSCIHSSKLGWLLFDVWNELWRYFYSIYNCSDLNSIIEIILYSNFQMLDSLIEIIISIAVNQLKAM